MNKVLIALLLVAILAIYGAQGSDIVTSTDQVLHENLGTNATWDTLITLDDEGLDTIRTAIRSTIMPRGVELYVTQPTTVTLYGTDINMLWSSSSEKTKTRIHVPIRQLIRRSVLTLDSLIIENETSATETVSININGKFR